MKPNFSKQKTPEKEGSRFESSRVCSASYIFFKVERPLNLPTRPNTLKSSLDYACLCAGSTGTGNELCKRGKSGNDGDSLARGDRNEME